MTEEQKQEILDITREKMQKEIIDWVTEERDLWVLAKILRPATMDPTSYETERIAETIAEETKATPEEAMEMAEELL